MTSRRNFFKWTLLSAAALTGGVASVQWLQEEDLSSVSSDYPFRFLNSQDRLILLSLIPVILGDENINLWHSKSVSTEKLFINIDATIAHFSQRTRQELRELFDLLWSRLGKLLLAGVWASWSCASTASIAAFIEEWRNSWLVVLNQGYLGIQQLIMAAFYAEEVSWIQCGYDGVPF